MRGRFALALELMEYSMLREPMESERCISKFTSNPSGALSRQVRDFPRRIERGALL